MRKIVYEQRPYFLPWVAAIIDRAPYDDRARTIAVVDVLPDGSEETLAVVVFTNWSSLKPPRYTQLFSAPISRSVRIVSAAT